MIDHLINHNPLAKLLMSPEFCIKERSSANKRMTDLTLVRIQTRKVEENYDQNFVSLECEFG